MTLSQEDKVTPGWVGGQGGAGNVPGAHRPPAALGTTLPGPHSSSTKCAFVTIPFTDEGTGAWRERIIHTNDPASGQWSRDLALPAALSTHSHLETEPPCPAAKAPGRGGSGTTTILPPHTFAFQRAMFPQQRTEQRPSLSLPRCQKIHSNLPFRNQACMT